MNDTLRAFRAKFEHKLRELREEFEGRLNDMRKFNREQFTAGDERLDKLERNINQEVQDRVDETDETINETQHVLTNLQNRFDGE